MHRVCIPIDAYIILLFSCITLIVCTRTHITLYMYTTYTTYTHAHTHGMVHDYLIMLATVHKCPLMHTETDTHTCVCVCAQITLQATHNVI